MNFVRLSSDVLKGSFDCHSQTKNFLTRRTTLLLHPNNLAKKKLLSLGDIACCNCRPVSVQKPHERVTVSEVKCKLLIHRKIYAHRSLEPWDGQKRFCVVDLSGYWELVAAVIQFAAHNFAEQIRFTVTFGAGVYYIFKHRLWYEIQVNSIFWIAYFIFAPLPDDIFRSLCYFWRALRQPTVCISRIGGHPVSADGADNYMLRELNFFATFFGRCEFPLFVRC